jgi:hypothetical protein
VGLFRKQLKVTSMLELLDQEISAVKIGLEAMGLSHEASNAVLLALAQARSRWPANEDTGQGRKTKSSPSSGRSQSRSAAAGNTSRSDTEEIAFLERMLRDDLSDDWGSAPAADW